MVLFSFFKKYKDDFGELVRVLKLYESEEETDRMAAARRWAKLCLQFHLVENQIFKELVVLAVLINEKRNRKKDFSSFAAQNLEVP